MVASNNWQPTKYACAASSCWRRTVLSHVSFDDADVALVGGARELLGGKQVLHVRVQLEVMQLRVPVTTVLLSEVPNKSSNKHAAYLAAEACTVVAGTLLVIAGALRGWAAFPAKAPAAALPAARSTTFRV